ncbi:hypothetical protein ACFYYR_05410 [Streptomyces sp. NPDC001922]|uniref:hypothetical protein n=1 Tax=Streptomyces sp. NPDC001922 TaxID=3364624 RepID=UPI0036C15227
MARKVCAGSRARRAALTAVREALERGEVPVDAPELVQLDAECWLGPDGRLYVRSAPLRPAGAVRLPFPAAAERVVDPRGCSAGEPSYAPDWRRLTPWIDDLSRLSRWREADGSWLVIDEV